MSEPADETRRLIDGFRHTAVVGAAVQTGVFDVLASGPQSVVEMNVTLGLSVAPLASLLRALVLMGVVAEVGEDSTGAMRYALTETGRTLVSDDSNPLPILAQLTVEQLAPAWLHLGVALRSNRTPFHDRFGMSVWDYRQQHAEAGELFNAWLGRQTGTATEPIIAACDLPASGHVVDVGGGQGTLLADILESFPGLRGTLAELPSVLRTAESYLGQRCLVDRCDLRPTNFFRQVPAGGDLYLLKSVLHDWQDDDCVRILRTIRAAMSAPARLLVVERLMPNEALDDPVTVWMDLHMICVTGGRERTQAEFATLCGEADLHLVRMRAAHPFHVLEIVRK